MMYCPKCGSQNVKSLTEEFEGTLHVHELNEGDQIYHGDVEAHKCNDCGTIFYTESN